MCMWLSNYLISQLTLHTDVINVLFYDTTNEKSFPVDQLALPLRILEVTGSNFCQEADYFNYDF